MYEIFEKLMAERGLKPADVAKATGLRKGFFSDWKAGRGSPKTDKIQILADFFNVSLEYLTTGKDTEMPADERRLLEGFRMLNAYGKEKVLNVLSDCLELRKYTEKNVSRSDVV